MAEFATVNISGASEIEAVLRQLPTRVAKNVVGKSLMAGGAVIVAELKANAPRGRYAAHVPPGHNKFGALADNIRRKTVKVAGFSMTVAVGIGAAFWGKFQEFGTSRMRAHPWFRRSFESSKFKALETIGETLGKGVETEALRLAGELGTRRAR